MTSPRTVTRLDVRHLAVHARAAIRDRLRYRADYALRAIERTADGAVILRLNSGGNAIAVETWLRARGYHTEDAGANPDQYGCAIRVTIPPDTPRRPGNNAA